MENKIRVAELFAGVGGFRIGLEGWKGKSSTSKFNKELVTPYQVVWSNQFEPSTKTQHASFIYEYHWGKEGHSNEDITSINVDNIPDHDLLVGGFPCQDYSVATTLKNSKGLIGKKGVLWWSIYHILTEKKEKKPKYLFLENVDRLLISPSTQRGRDFAVILQSLNKLGYAVEWRVINAADYGFPQRRRRTFILAYHLETPLYQEVINFNPIDWLTKEGTIAQAFPVKACLKSEITCFKLVGELDEISRDYNPKVGVFANTGLMVNGKVTTLKTNSEFEGQSINLGDIIQTENIDPEFFIDSKQIDKWAYQKDSKKIERINSSGFSYLFSEGAMSFPDPLDRPSRTIITGEGGPSASRFKHVIYTNNQYRRLTPIELERLNMFPDNHTKMNGVSNGKRAFLMGNALVVGVIERIGQSLIKKIIER